MDHLWIFLFSLIFTAATWLAVYFSGFFSPLKIRKPFVSFKEAICAFSLFLSMQLLVLPLLIYGVTVYLGNERVSLEVKGWMNLSSIFLLGMILILYTSSLRPKVQWLTFKNGLKNLLIGAGSWVLAFPLIVMITQILTIVFSDWLGYELQEQLAVKQVKSFQEFPFLFAASLFTVTVLVPTIEELLFRGFLQDCLLKKLTMRQSIMATSTLFSLFHFSSSQGMNNVLILTSLFVLSCLLGYLKERQNSLIPAIALHGTFNGISLVQIFLLQ